MSNPVTFYIDSDLYSQCELLIDNGEFFSDSEIVDFATRLFYYQARINGLKPKYIKHDRGVKKSIRVNQYILNYFVEYGRFKKTDLVDYALDYLFECRKKFTEERSIFE